MIVRKFPSYRGAPKQARDLPPYETKSTPKPVLRSIKKVTLMMHHTQLCTRTSVDQYKGVPYIQHKMWWCAFDITYKAQHQPPIQVVYALANMAGVMRPFLLPALVGLVSRILTY